MSDQDFRDRTIDRLARLETMLAGDREICRQIFHRLDVRLRYLETRGAEAMTMAGWVKLALAIALPLGVLLTTGSIEHARRALTLFGAP